MRRFILTITVLAQGAIAETATIYYDEFGIPHIHAKTAEAGMYASGWAMAADRLVQTLENYLRGMGRFSAAYGPGDNGENVRADLQSLMWDHYGTSKRLYHTLPRAFRRHNQAFVEGINAWMRENPQGVPAWWTYGEVDPYMPVAFSRQFIWSWPLGQAEGDLRAIGLRSEFDLERPYSNEMAIAPAKSTSGHAMLVIDPHLGWFGRQRYWELRLHAGDIHISGFATAGFPYVNLGHNEHVAWAHTTGGPDTADIFALTLDPANAMRYRYDDGFRELKTRKATLVVKGEPDREVTFYDSHHGPIVKFHEGKAYAAALSYAEAVGYLYSKYLFMIAKDYQDVITALEVCEIMPQNVMVADTKGNIYYQRTGRVPVRAAGYDYSRPVNGSISRTEWRGLHPTKDFVQILNPPQGYMQNCNITPDVMMVGSTMTADKYPDYIFNQPALLTHQRATRATEVLHTTAQFTAESFIELALDRKCYQFERWIEALTNALETAPDARTETVSHGLRRLHVWDGFQERDSNGALIYYYWRHTLADQLGVEGNRALIARINNYLELFGVTNDTPAALSPEENAALIQAFADGLDRMIANHGGLDAVFGDVFRAGRLDYAGDAVSYPVGGGSLRDEGMATVRAIGFTDERADHTRWGDSGQTSTQVVVLSNPIQSWTQPPIGQSDHPDSPHFRDQAEKLLSAGRMKPSWFRKEELLDGHVVRTIEIAYPN